MMGCRICGTKSFPKQTLTLISSPYYRSSRTEVEICSLHSNESRRVITHLLPLGWDYSQPHIIMFCIGVLELLPRDLLLRWIAVNLLTNEVLDEFNWIPCIETSDTDVIIDILRLDYLDGLILGLRCRLFSQSFYTNIWRTAPHCLLCRHS